MQALACGRDTACNAYPAYVCIGQEAGSTSAQPALYPFRLQAAGITFVLFDCWEGVPLILHHVCCIFALDILAQPCLFLVTCHAAMTHVGVLASVL